MSEHTVEVVKIVDVRNHENADSLDIVRVWGYECIVRKGSFQPGDLAAFIEPDYVVDTTREEFRHLAKNATPDGKYRVRTAKLRGVRSFGVLLPAPEGMVEGDCAMEYFGVARWVPPSDGRGDFCQETSRPPFFVPDYGLENARKTTIALGTEVVITEKMHGTNARYVYSEGILYVGSHHKWRKDGHWQAALDAEPWVQAWCEAHPGYTLFGEIVGPTVQGTQFGYGLSGIGFFAFDVLRPGSLDYLTWDEFKAAGLQRTVPVVYEGPYLGIDDAQEKAEAQSFFAGQSIREGVVVKTVSEPRVAVKVVSSLYLEKS